MKKCNSCKKMLPEDSEFCQYCGSKNISEYIEPKPVPITPVKKCKQCGKELPEDSEFCQYCGSKNIIEQNIYLNTDAVLANTTNNKKIKGNILLIPLIVASIAALTFGYGMYYNYKNYNELYETTEEEISRLNANLTRARADSSANNKKASYYNEVLNYANYSNGYSDFYARQTLLRKPNKKTVWIYFGYYNINVWAQGSSGSVKCEWGNGDGHWMPLTITYTGSGVEYVKLTNDRNNEVIYITLLGD